MAIEIVDLPINSMVDLSSSLDFAIQKGVIFQFVPSLRMVIRSGAAGRFLWAPQTVPGKGEDFSDPENPRKMHGNWDGKPT